MIKVLSWHLSNIVYFKNVSLKLRPGITVIRGLNKNSANVQKNTNAVGKSLLVSAFSNVVYAATPLSTKKNEKKQLFSEKAGKISLSLKSGKTSWDIEQFSKGKSIGYKIIKNGVDTKIHNPTQAEAKIRSEIFPLSEDLFYTTVLLSNLRFPAFIRGTAAQRHAFFTELFSMDHFQKVKAQFQLQLKELKADKIRRDNIKDQLSEIDSRLNTISWNDTDEKSLNTLSTDLDELNTKYLKTSEKLDELKAMLVIAKRIAYIKGKLGKYREKDLDALKEKKSELKTALKDLQAYSEWLRASKKYKKDIEGIVSKKELIEKAISKIVATGSLTEEKDKLEELETKREALASDAKHIKQLRVEYSEIEDTLPDKKPSRSIAELEEHATSLRQLIQIGEALGSSKLSKCPVCSSKLSAVDVKTAIKDAKKLLPKVERDIESAIGFSELTKIKSRAEKYKNCESKLDVVRSKIAKVQKVIEALEDKKKLANELKYIDSAVKKIAKPDKVTKPDNCDKDELESGIEKVDSAISWLKELRDATALATKTFSKAVDDKEIEKEISTLEIAQRKLGRKVSDINERLPDLLVRQKQWLQLRSDRKDLIDKLNKINEGLKDLPVLEAIIKAYSSKGLKTVLMKELANLVCNNLNLYAPLIFAENFKFSMDITDTSFNVLVDRGNKKVSDINKLSGAETACFSLLLLLSTLPLIPNSKRTDFVMLDELDANLGEPLKELFVNKFLPMLATIIPKILVITTSRKLKFPDVAENLLIVKDGDESVIQPLLDFGGMV